jgi:hypothetical protein
MNQENDFHYEDEYYSLDVISVSKHKWKWITTTIFTPNGKITKNGFADTKEKAMKAAEDFLQDEALKCEELT